MPSMTRRDMSKILPVMERQKLFSIAKSRKKSATYLIIGIILRWSARAIINGITGDWAHYACGDSIACSVSPEMATYFLKTPLLFS